MKNNNKGFISIGLIIAVIAALSLVGGGAYYLGQKKAELKQIDQNLGTLQPSTPLKDFSNMPTNNTSQITQEINTQKPTPASGCTPATPPYVKVISPNGGEVYNYTDSGSNNKIINVKWSICNAPNNSKIKISLVRQDKYHVSDYANIDNIKNNFDWIYYGTSGGYNEPIVVTAPGEYKFRVALYDNSVGYPAPEITFDFSDAPFIIN